MPDDHTQAEEKLRKLGERVREGHALTHPVREESLDTVRQAIREQYEREQVAKRDQQPSKDTKKDRDRQPPEPER